ncbi:general substrate transporter [Halteromyces radiatus]|uniref:general substrate transporter n=1 Tax=Halteromyces radiatus TaxID=101107 RepID=UPI00221E51FB|nr:general substrate transporter [Halteromyces radiatus]KAI8084933.1 general substrate transporter [Halteromyces radiatus]
MPQSAISKCTGGDSHSTLPACLPMSDFSWGYTVAAYPIGGVVGSFVSMYSNVWLGRRHNIMLTCILFIIGNIISAVSINVPMYSIGRAIVGIAAGMCGSSVSIYVSEISTNKARGALGSLFELFLNAGVLFTQLCGLYMSYDPLWRFLWGISAILAAIQMLCLFLFTVECPRRLCANKEYDRAAAALQKLRAGADVEEEFAMLLAARQREVESAIPTTTIWDIVTFKNLHITWRTIIIMVIQAYNQAGGIGPMSVYSVGFFTEIFNGDTHMATSLSLADGAVNTAATLVSVMFVHKLGRKNLMMASLLGCTLGCILMVVGAHNTSLGGIIIAAAIIYIGFYSLGCGVIPWFIAPELVPMHALASASALGSSCNWLMNFVINILWPYISANLGQNAFCVFIAINFVGFLFVVFFMPETTGKDLDDSDEKSPGAEHHAESGTSSSHATDEKEEKREVEYLEK